MSAMEVRHPMAPPYVIPVSQVSIMQNLAQIDYCRTSASVASGCTAGILGLTGIWGFIFYFFTASIVSMLLVFQVGHSWNKYFLSRKQFALHGLFGGLFTYILFWTFLYGMVHVY